MEPICPPFDDEEAPPAPDPPPLAFPPPHAPAAPAVEIETGVVAVVDVDDESVSQINIDSVEFEQFGVVPVEPLTVNGDEFNGGYKW